jgi:hypothetical protein
MSKHHRAHVIPEALVGFEGLVCTTCDVAITDIAQHRQTSNHLKNYLHKRGLDIYKIKELERENTGRAAAIRRLGSQIAELHETCERLAVRNRELHRLNRQLLRAAGNNPTELAPAGPAAHDLSETSDGAAIKNFEDLNLEITLAYEDFLDGFNLPRLIAKSIFCDPRRPQNHCVVWAAEDDVMWIRQYDDWQPFDVGTSDFRARFADIQEVVWSTQNRIASSDRVTAIFRKHGSTPPPFLKSGKKISVTEFHQLMGKFFSQCERSLRERGFEAPTNLPSEDEDRDESSDDEDPGW